MSKKTKFMKKKMTFSIEDNARALHIVSAARCIPVNTILGESLKLRLKLDKKAVQVAKWNKLIGKRRKMCKVNILSEKETQNFLKILKSSARIWGELVFMNTTLNIIHGDRIYHPEVESDTPNMYWTQQWAEKILYGDPFVKFSIDTPGHPQNLGMVDENSNIGLQEDPVDTAVEKTVDSKRILTVQISRNDVASCLPENLRHHVVSVPEESTLSVFVAFDGTLYELTTGYRVGQYYQKLIKLPIPASSKVNLMRTVKKLAGMTDKCTLPSDCCENATQSEFYEEDINGTDKNNM